jgi:hypothetical protein
MHAVSFLHAIEYPVHSLVLLPGSGILAENCLNRHQRQRPKKKYNPFSDSHIIYPLKENITDPVL